MKGDAKVIEALNRALTIELTAINQYFVQAKMLANWGYQGLAKKMHEESIGEMKHADSIIERILFLEGVPNIAKYDVIRVGTDVKEQLENDLRLESGGVKHSWSRARTTWTGWRRSWTSSRRWGCRTTCRRSWAS
jgi:bacterioferritin